MHMWHAWLDCPWRDAITTVISGGARGADAHGEALAVYLDVPCERYPADWDKHGRRAGLIRNAEMAKIADALLAVWDGKSRGTLHMINQARKRGLRVHVYRYAA